MRKTRLYRLFRQDKHKNYLSPSGLLTELFLYLQNTPITKSEDFKLVSKDNKIFFSRTPLK